MKILQKKTLMRLGAAIIALSLSASACNMPKIPIMNEPDLSEPTLSAPSEVIEATEEETEPVLVEVTEPETDEPSTETDEKATEPISEPDELTKPAPEPDGSTPESSQSSSSESSDISSESDSTTAETKPPKTIVTPTQTETSASGTTVETSIPASSESGTGPAVEKTDPSTPSSTSSDETSQTSPSTADGSTSNEGANSGYQSLGLPKPGSHRRFRSGFAWPENYRDSFSTIEITPDVRKDILAFGTALVGLPYVYPRTDTWWAPDSKYSYSYDVLYQSRKTGGSAGYFDYVYGPDCSAFVKAAVDFATGSKMHNYVPGMRAAMLSRPEYEKPINDMSKWIPGDILILGEGEGSYRHVAIYFGDGLLLHSVGYRVQISHISDWSFRPRGDLFVKHVFAPPGVLGERSNVPPSGSLTLPADFVVPVEIPANIRNAYGIVSSPAATPKPTTPTTPVATTPTTPVPTTPATTASTTSTTTTTTTTKTTTASTPSTTTTTSTTTTSTTTTTTPPSASTTKATTTTTTTTPTPKTSSSTSSSSTTPTTTTKEAPSTPSVTPSTTTQTPPSSTATVAKSETP